MAPALSTMERSARRWSAAAELVLRLGTAEDFDALDESIRRMAGLVEARRWDLNASARRASRLSADPFRGRWLGSGI